MFDPSKYGATEVTPSPTTPTGFDPSKYGAVPVASTSPDPAVQHIENKLNGNTISNFAQSALKFVGNTTGVSDIYSALKDSTDLSKPFGETLKKAAGGAAKLGSTAASFGSGAIPAVGKGAVQKAAIEGLKSGAVFGGVQGLGDSLSENKSASDTLESSVKGAALGGAVGGIAGGALAELSNRAKLTTVTKAKAVLNDTKKSVSDVDRLVGTIAQGKKADVQKAKKALSSINIEGVKTYDDLHRALDERVGEIASSLDKKLATSAEIRKLPELSTTLQAGEKTINHNYVDDALNHLEELYQKTNDPVGESMVSQLRSKAQNQGLTIKEINDLARTHGSEFAGKAFSRTGEALTSVNAQAFENTRKGLKDTARGLFKDSSFKAMDEEMSNVIRARDLVQKTAEGVNKLKQLTTERGLGEKIGRLVFQVADKISGGGLKGFVQSFIPRSGGLKVMNALDLEKGLQKNLKLLQEINGKGLPPEMIIKKLEQIINQ